MAWATRRRKRYFYRSVRFGDVVVKQYLGHGGEAEAAAKKIAQQEADRDARRSSYEDEIERNREGERVLIDLRRWLNLLTHATMILKGYYKHNGQYRRRHHVRRSKG